MKTCEQIFKYTQQIAGKKAAVDSHNWDWDWKKRENWWKNDFCTKAILKVQTILMSF